MTHYSKNDPDSIRSLFNQIAKNYDRTNEVLSFRLHNHWNRSLIKHVAAQQNPAEFLDLCCGTGEIAFAYLKQAKQQKKVYLVDFSEEMLKCAQEKAKLLQYDQHQISYIQADVQTLPLHENSMDCATIAYGIRNVKDPKSCAQEVFRVLRPQGVFGILELTRPKNPFFRFCYLSYLKGIIPVLGKIFTSNQEAYQYLCNSIKNFIEPEALIAILQSAGFSDVYQKPLWGGVATIICGRKK